MRQIITFLLLVSFLATKAIYAVMIQPDNDNIQFTGVLETEKSAQGLMLYRFKKDYIDANGPNYTKVNAGCQSGITISIKTKSPTVAFKFSLNSNYEDRFANVYLYRNGADTYKNVWGGKGVSLSPADSVSTDTALSIWTCILPPFKAQFFQGIELADGFDILPMKEKSRPVYVALGNSITHGTGNEGATRNTYPWKVAQALDYELYNLAVGASGINTQVLDNLKDINPDLITILWGYNDRNRLDNAMPKYDTLLSRLVKEFPTTKIVAIGQTYTTTTTNIPQLRTRQLEIITRLQKEFSNLYYIAGDDYTTWEDVKVDGIHLTPDGATSLAEGLIKELRPITGVYQSKVNLDTVITTKYSVTGNLIHDEKGNPIHFRGVNRPSLEWSSLGKSLNEADIKSIAATGANIIRLPLNQDFWLKNTNNYQERVDTIVYWCMKYGLNTILDNHRSQNGHPDTIPDIKHHADVISLEFLYKLATKYKDNGKIIFELYNEPHQISWEEIYYGGIHDNDTPEDESDDWEMIGYQALFDTLRASGAENLVIIGGNNWSFDLSYYESNPIAGSNIIYATHCYPFNNKQPEDWYQWTVMARNYPVIMSEFGPGDKIEQEPDNIKGIEYLDELLDTMNHLGVHWTAWAWYTFEQNNMWNSIYPEVELYDTTDFGSWVINELKKGSEEAISFTDSKYKNTSKGLNYSISGNKLFVNINAPYVVELYTSNGRRVYKQKTEKQVIDFRQIALAAGVYQLQITYNSRVYRNTLQIQ